MSDPAKPTLSYSRHAWRPPRVAIVIFATVVLLTILSFASPVAVGWTGYRKYTLQLAPGSVEWVVESERTYDWTVATTPVPEMEIGYRERVAFGFVPVVKLLARRTGASWSHADCYPLPLVPLVVMSGLFLLWRIRRSLRDPGA